MKLLNMSVNNFVEYSSKKNIYLYGLGEVFLNFIKKDIYLQIQENVEAVLDNGKNGIKMKIMDKTYDIHNTQYLKQVKNGLILICSNKCIDDMYDTLCQMKLSDDFECFILPLLWAVSDGADEQHILDVLNCKKGKAQIDKKIHCFWFSDEKKPQEYQKCIDSWKRVCPEYEIIEWNAHNYDCEKNVFIKQAFKKKKWAFVSDYARLDVIYRYGGVYLDMDVELLQNLEPWLGCKAFFNFGTQHDVDLGSGFGSIKNNSFIGKMLSLYDNKEFCDANGIPMVWKYVQPGYIREAFKQIGFKMDGNMQMIDDMLLLPRHYHTPIDDFLFEDYALCERTRGIHHYNAGWCSKDFMEQRKVSEYWYEVYHKNKI